MSFEFRAWDLKHSVMLDHQQLMEKQYPQHMKRDPFHYDVFKDITLLINMRSNFEDMDGRPIFQGDVIETKDSKSQRFCYEVIFDEETSCFMALPFMKGRYGWTVGYTTTTNPQPLKDIIGLGAYIIGNKYQNQELYKRGV